MEFVGLGMLALGILWVAGFGFAHFRAVGKAKAAQAWPAAAGRVVSSEVVEDRGIATGAAPPGTIRSSPTLIQPEAAS